MADRGPILLVSEVFPPQKGGSGRWLWELYRGLGPDVSVVSADVPGAAAFDHSAGLDITRGPLALPTWSPFSPKGLVAYVRAFLMLRRRIRMRRPAALHCGKALPEGLLALACSLLYRIPYVCFVHGEELRLAHTSRDLAWLTRQVLRRASLLIANSAHTAALLRDDWGSSLRTTVMHPGVDATRFVPGPERADQRARLGWAGRRVVLTVGALQKRKGQDMLIRALPAIRAACPDVLYVMVGDPWERPYLDQLIDEVGVRDSVQFLDVHSDDELVACYQHCDLFALPNRQDGWDFEGFGIVLLEAQACGKAVLAGRSGGTAETLQPGLTGELVACETPGPLADAVIALLDNADRRREMGARGRDWVVGHFDWQALRRQAARVFSTPLPGAR